MNGGINTYGYVGGNPLIYVDSFGLAKATLTINISGIVGPFGGSKSGGIGIDDEGNVCSIFITCQTNGEAKGKDGSAGLFVGAGLGASLSDGEFCDSQTDSTKDSLSGGFFGAAKGSLTQSETGSISAAKGVAGLGLGGAITTEQCTTSVHCF